MSGFVVVCFGFHLVVMHEFENKEQREKNVVSSMQCGIQEICLTLSDHEKKKQLTLIDSFHLQ